MTAFMLSGVVVTEAVAYGIFLSGASQKEALIPGLEYCWKSLFFFLLPLVWYGHGDSECWKPSCV